MAGFLKKHLGLTEATATKDGKDNAIKKATRRQASNEPTTEELFGDLESSKRKYFRGDGDDARAVAEAEGFVFDADEEFKIEVQTSDEGVPLIFEGLDVVYQRHKGDPFIDAHALSKVNPHPEDVSTWAKERSFVALAINPRTGEKKYAECPPELVQAILPIWAKYECAYANAMAQYLGSPRQAQPGKKRSRIESVDDLTTVEIAAIVGDGEYTILDLRELSPKKLRKVYLQYFDENGKPVRKPEAKSENATEPKPTSDPEPTKQPEPNQAKKPEGNGNRNGHGNSGKPGKSGKSGKSGKKGEKGNNPNAASQNQDPGDVAAGAVAVAVRCTETGDTVMANEVIPIRMKAEADTLVTDPEFNQYLSNVLDRSPEQVRFVVDTVFSEEHYVALYTALKFFYEKNTRPTDDQLEGMVGRILVNIEPDLEPEDGTEESEDGTESDPEA